MEYERCAADVIVALLASQGTLSLQDACRIAAADLLSVPIMGFVLLARMAREGLLILGETLVQLGPAWAPFLADTARSVHGLS